MYKLTKDSEKFTFMMNGNDLLNLLPPKIQKKFKNEELFDQNTIIYLNTENCEDLSKKSIDECIKKSNEILSFVRDNNEPIS